MLKCPSAMMIPPTSTLRYCPQMRPGTQPPKTGGRYPANPAPPKNPPATLGCESESTLGDRRGHEENEQRLQPVEAEPLPHLGEEQRGQAARMSEPARRVA